MKAKAAAVKHKKMKSNTAAAKHKETKAKAAVANIASKQYIASAFLTPSPTAKSSVRAKTMSTGDLPTFPTRGIECGPGQESTWATEAVDSLFTTWNMDTLGKRGTVST